MADRSLYRIMLYPESVRDNLQVLEQDLAMVESGANAFCSLQAGQEGQGQALMRVPTH